MKQNPFIQSGQAVAALSFEDDPKEPGALIVTIQALRESDVLAEIARLVGIVDDEGGYAEFNKNPYRQYNGFAAKGKVILWKWSYEI